jgi:hypothetical protein
MSKNDIYDISGRVKNLIAMEDIALSPVGTVLVNYHTLMLKGLYDFSDGLPEPHNSGLKRLLGQAENVPLSVIKVSSPKEEQMSLYEQVMRLKPQFPSAQDALAHLQSEYDGLGKRYSMTGDEFWIEAENSGRNNDDTRMIRKLHMQIGMCNYLINKEKKDLASEEEPLDSYEEEA